MFTLLLSFESQFYFLNLNNLIKKKNQNMSQSKYFARKKQATKTLKD